MSFFVAGRSLAALGLMSIKHKALLEANAKREEEKAKAAGDWKELEDQLLTQHADEIGKRDTRSKTLLTALEEQLVTRAALESLSKQKAQERI